MAKPRRVHLYRDKINEWRWRLVAVNGKTVAESGEGYAEFRDCFGMAWALYGANVVYETEGGTILSSPEDTRGVT
jgi:hypothetical protein